MANRSGTSERARTLALYIVENTATIRQAAEEFGISKSTVHVDITDRIQYVDWQLYKKVRKVLDYNISQRAIRGGQASRRKYKKNPKK